MIIQTNMQAQKDFKNDFGFSIGEAEIKLRNIKESNEELWALRCIVNGFCSRTNEKINLSGDDKKAIQIRIDELIK
tara:strand:+ start:955 stop:1182 length:228 start_codon:yes stop_codon:yes gene_type:complete